MTKEKLLRRLCDEVDELLRSRVVSDADMLYVFEELGLHIESRADLIRADLTVYDLTVRRAEGR